MQLIVDGLHVTGSDTGRGKTALLLHGWRSDHRTFAPIVPALKGYRVIAPDMPGFGGSQVPPEAWTVGDYADFTKQLLDKLEIKQIDVIVGHSFGGRIALDLTARYPTSARRMVLLASHGLPEPPSLKRGVASIAAKAGKVATALMPQSIRDRLRRQLYRWAGSSDYVESGVMRDTFLQVIKQDVSKYAHNITVPTLLLYGADDATTPPKLGRRLAELIGESQFETVDGAGHYLHVDQPEVVARRLLQWLG